VGDDAVLETGRLLLRRMRIADAALLRELWTERDPRVPPHRRIDADGHPTVADQEDWIRGRPAPGDTGLLMVELRDAGTALGYCGLIDGGRGADQPEIAFELLRASWGAGFATEAATAVVGWARASGHRRLWATVWEWNTASRGVLAKLGFVEVDREQLDAPHGPSLVTRLELRAHE
jgi:[ribosomal protein S5]-alanine N-acetyltransferase